MKDLERFSVVWSEYMKYRAGFRRFGLTKIEDVIRYSRERYFDTVTRRMIVVGKHDDRLVMIPYERKGNEIIPVTIHATTRQQCYHRSGTGPNPPFKMKPLVSKDAAQYLGSEEEPQNSH